MKDVNPPYLPMFEWSSLSWSVPLNVAVRHVSTQSLFWCEAASLCQPNPRWEAASFQHWQTDELTDGQTDRWVGGAWQPVNRPGQTGLALQMHPCMLVLIWTPASRRQKPRINARLRVSVRFFWSRLFRVLAASKLEPLQDEGKQLRAKGSRCCRQIAAANKDWDSELPIR